jgi:hypothetical protein
VDYPSPTPPCVLISRPAESTNVKSFSQFVSLFFSSFGRKIQENIDGASSSSSNYWRGYFGFPVWISDQLNVISFNYKQTWNRHRRPANFQLPKRWGGRKPSVVLFGGFQIVPCNLFNSRAVVVVVAPVLVVQQHGPWERQSKKKKTTRALLLLSSRRQSPDPARQQRNAVGLFCCFFSYIRGVYCVCNDGTSFFLCPLTFFFFWLSCNSPFGMLICLEMWDAWKPPPKQNKTKPLVRFFGHQFRLFLISS